MWLVGAVRSGGGDEDVESEWREILKGDNERERSGGNAAAGAPFPPGLSALICVSWPSLFHLYFQLSQLNGAAALLSVVENETQ